ncbi:MAG: hypothetical protein RIQ81_2075 [Pseudomonadota bacterium]|jgi:error-prone DNA polymerase
MSSVARNNKSKEANAILNALGWNEWLAHTNFSFLVGASHPHEMLERANALNYRGIAITDFDGAYGLARSHRSWKKLGSDMRLFHGAEIHLGRDHELPVVLQDTVALIARTRRGYANLCRILTRCHADGKQNAWVPVESLGAANATQDLAAIVPMRGLVRSGQDQAYEARIAHLKECFGKNLYLTVSRHFHPGEDAWIKSVTQAARRFDVPILLTQDAFFHHSSQKPVSDLLHAIRTNARLDDCIEHMFVNGERSLHDLGNLASRFGELPFFQSAIEASARLASECDFTMDELRYRYPEEMIPEGHTAQSFLEHITWQAAKARYGSPLSSRMADVLAHELRLIDELKFADYFLTVWDIVRWARERSILCQGRGSAANSAVCFVLGITAVDPSLYDLLFERFISVERGDPPDIDVDFEHERREEVIQYIYSRYGRGRAAMVANIITFRSRGAARATGKALGMPDELLEDARESMKDHPVWSEMSARIKGFPRHLGIHSGGFMLSNDPLDEIVPQEPATMPGRSVVQWCKDDIEALGFFKIDILALGMLTAVRKCFDSITSHYGHKLTLDTVPQEDPATYAMIQRADTVGTFQIESRAQMSMLPRLRPRTFYDLVVEVAIIRPGPIQGGMIQPYLRRRSGEEPVVFPDERLRPILARTLGIPIFQEQVMRIAIAVGDFTPGEANELRRHMGAWTIKGDIGPWLTRLANGMRKNGISEKFVGVILAQMRGFAEYGFPESHAASFAIIAYVSSWLKCHYPAAFFQSVLNSQPMGFYSPMALVQAARRCGVAVLPVCVQKSAWDHQLEVVKPADPASGRPPAYAIRLGMRLVRGLREGAARALAGVRPPAGWGSASDFFRGAPDAGIYRSDLASLAAAGAFATLGLTRKDAFWMAEAAPHIGLMGDVEEPHTFAAESAMESVQQDLHATGVALGEHPAKILRDDYWCFDVPVAKLCGSKELAACRLNSTVQVFGMVLVRQAPPSAKGMVFFTLEDEHGYINLVFTPQAYSQFARLVDHQAFLCVSGKIQGEKQGYSVLVQRVHEPVPPRGEVIPLAQSEAPDTNSPAFQKARNYM